MKKLITVFLFVLIIISIQCTSKNTEQSSKVVIGIPADVESFNPLFAYNFMDGNISELLFMSLVKHRWDPRNAELISEPMLATNWEWDNDSSSIIVNLREDVKWSDGVQLTAEDVAFSFDVYADPDVQSKALGFFENFITDENGKVNVDESFEILSPYKLKINFRDGSKPSMLDIDHPIVPKHILGIINRTELSNSNFNQNPVTSGPFLLSEWKRNQAIYLKIDKESFLYTPESISTLIFKIVPEYNARILQLTSGEIDLIGNVKPEDVERIKQNPSLDIKPVSGREYDYIGWNLIDPKGDAEKENFFFNNVNVRKALTHSLNREEIVKEYLYDYGQLSAGPVSPLYTDAIDENQKPLDYNPSLAKELLLKEGWIDADGNGILEKDGKEFKFNMYVPTGNPRRKYAATIFQNNLKEIGVSAKVEFVEIGAFIDAIFEKQYDAWMVGWIIPLPINLKIQWYSNSSTTPMNFATYKSEDVDKLLELLEGNISKAEKNRILKKINNIIHNDQPFSFLYWIDEVTAYNTKIKNIDFSPLGVIHHCWDWSVN